MSARVIRKPGVRRPVINARTGKPALPPESLAQAQRATARGEQLRALGVDPLCAGRLAFAAQEGAAPVDPPCATCLPLVESLGGSRANDWRVPFPCTQSSSEVTAA
jgi:hypothetical protein